MSRKTVKKAAPKVTAPVTGPVPQNGQNDSPHLTNFDKLIGGMEAAGVFGPAPGKVHGAKEPSIKQKQAALKVIEPGVMQAMDYAHDVGVTQGKVLGIQQGLRMPRTAGEQRAQQERPTVALILQEVFVEAQKAIQKHGPMHSPHEGLGVIMEEFDELKDEIYADRGKQASARAEAVQLAAMAVRYILNVNPR